MVLQLKIQIKGISKPPVWRKVLVPVHFTFRHLHHVIQAAFGWTNSHLYVFSPKGYRSQPQIGIPDDSVWEDRDTLDSEKIKLSEVLKNKGMKYTYIYDFGDDWVHDITIEDILEQKTIRASLIAGKGACPPEDCGGVWGYENLVEILSDIQHPEYEEMCEWLGLDEGEIWDKHYFDLETAQKHVDLI